MSEMLDRIARAIDPSAFAQHDDTGGKNWNNRRRLALSRARRAVGAMTSPGVRILGAGVMAADSDGAKAHPALHMIRMESAWHAMITEILK